MLIRDHLYRDLNHLLVEKSFDDVRLSSNLVDPVEEFYTRKLACLWVKHDVPVALHLLRRVLSFIHLR